jgi:hypothetical protein
MVTDDFCPLVYQARERDDLGRMSFLRQSDFSGKMVLEIASTFFSLASASVRE